MRKNAFYARWTGPKGSRCVMVGSVVEHIETAVGTSSGAALALEVTIALTGAMAVKSAVLVGGVDGRRRLCTWV